MAGTRTLMIKRVTCPRKDCKKVFDIERYGVRDRVVKDKCPFCKTEVKVKF